MSEPAVALSQVFCLHRTAQGDAAALQGITLEVAAGEQLCVLGPSGAGKTTLLQVIAGLQLPSAGTVTVFGQDPGRLRPDRRAALRHRWIGLLQAAPPPDLTAAEAVALPLALRSASGAQRRARVKELLSAVGLGGQDRAPVQRLSGGERQRVALCAALAHRPRLLLADEPTAELDAASASEVAGLISELASAGGTTLIVVAHDPALAEASQRTVHLQDGRIASEDDGGGSRLMLSADGWLRLPDELRAQAGFGAAVAARRSSGGIVLTPAGSQLTPPSDATRLRGRARPARVAVEHVSVHRGRGAARRPVLDDVSAVFPPGELSVVTGPSGSGKTTLLEVLAGLSAPDLGRVRIDEHELSGLDADERAALRRAMIGYLTQAPTGIGFLSAVENTALAQRLRGLPGEAAHAHARTALDAVALGGRAGQRLSRLSAGEVQRAGLATAVACSGGVLLADEPTSRLDRASAAIALRALTTAARDGNTVICATHDPAVTAAAAFALELGAPADPAALRAQTMPARSKPSR